MKTIAELQIAELEEEIRQICLKPDTLEIESNNYLYLLSLCKELVNRIEDKDEYEKVLDNLPRVASETIEPLYVNRRVNERVNRLNSVDELLNNLHGDDFKSLNPLTKLYREKLKEKLKEKLEKKLAAVTSLDELSVILSKLSEEIVPTRGEDLIKKFTTLFKTQKDLLNSLNVLKKPRLKELLIETLDVTGRLAKLKGRGCTKDILQLFNDDTEDNAVFRDIIQRAFSKQNNVARFFKRAFCWDTSEQGNFYAEAEELAGFAQRGHYRSGRIAQ